MSTVSEAERLKAEGNALFAKNDFSGAYQKYSEALKHDQKNAILYCNRAACSLGLHRYLDAGNDATKATELDSKYAKAWGRLAAARMGLNRPDLVAKAWQKALDALPKENLTPAQQKQKDQYTQELATAEAKVADLIANPKTAKDFVSVSDRTAVPWVRGMAMIPVLSVTGQWNSSAWVIVRAYTEWDLGLKRLKEMKQVRTSRGMGVTGQRGVIADLCNALLTDERVFHITDPNFINMYNQQMMLEINESKVSWTDKGVREVMESVPKQLAEYGWDSVRYALSVTVRAWIMRAFMDDRLKNDPGAALQFLTSALEVLRWGSQLWKDVSFEDKGAIFQPTFIRGVKCMHLNTFIKAYQMNPGPNSKYSLEEVLAGTESLLEELADAPTSPNLETDDVALFLSFTRYPTGLAHSLQGFYHHEKAKSHHKAAGGALSDDVVKEFSLTSEAYARAASYYPPDDETHVWFLHCALQAQLQAGSTVESLLAMLDSIHRAIPLAKQIWEFSANAQMGQQAQITQDMALRDKFRGMLERGEVQAKSVLLKNGNKVEVRVKS